MNLQESRARDGGFSGAQQIERGGICPNKGGSYECSTPQQPEKPTDSPRILHRGGSVLVCGMDGERCEDSCALFQPCRRVLRKGRSHTNMTGGMPCESCGQPRYSSDSRSLPRQVRTTSTRTGTRYSPEACQTTSGRDERPFAPSTEPPRSCLSSTPSGFRDTSPSSRSTTAQRSWTWAASARAAVVQAGCILVAAPLTSVSCAEELWTVSAIFQRKPISPGSRGSTDFLRVVYGAIQIMDMPKSGYLPPPAQESPFWLPEQSIAGQDTRSDTITTDTRRDTRSDTTDTRRDREN